MHSVGGVCSRFSGLRSTSMSLFVSRGGEQIIMRLKVAVTLSLLLLASVCLAQEITGTIVGTVKDPQGAVLPNATVPVTNTDQNVVVRTVKTDANGNYVAPLLPIGHYSVAVTADGFKKTSQTK